MNNKGFTLMELIASIVILAIIMAIAIPATSNISKLIKNNQRNNVIKEIEIAAEKYAFDSGETLIFVDKLVTEGYLESDEDNNVYDPSNSERMNCYLVEMTKEGSHYTAQFLDTNYDNNGVCDLNKLNTLNTDVQITVLNNNKVVTNTELNNWLTGTITLVARDNKGNNIDCTKNQCSWTSSSGYSKIGTHEITIDNIVGVLDARYTFQVTMYETNGKINRYTNSKNIKVDNEKPIIYASETKITDRFATDKDKNVTIMASDKGSGITGYYIGAVASCTASLSYSTSNTIKVSKGAKRNYKICVKDKVGNIASADITF